jgi:hypothetical protein
VGDICQIEGNNAIQSDGAIARGGANATTFNLDDLDQSVSLFLQITLRISSSHFRHNFIEHDGDLICQVTAHPLLTDRLPASLSRQDFFFGDDHSFNATIYASTKASAKAGLHTPETAGPVRAARIADSAAHDPTFVLSESHATLAWGESAFFLSVLGDPVTGIANATFVDSLFEHERLPFDLGWSRREVQTNQTSVGLLIVKLQAAAKSTAVNAD